jgi:tripartite-type tricarboxylate transporter receptor subunit TctC
MRFLRAALLASGVLLAVAPAVASGPAGYPARPVSIVVPFAPGGGSDNIARLLATRLAERTKGTFIVDNKPGAGTNIGNEAVSRATPDGYTLLFGQVTLSINPHVYRGLRYDVQKDFAPVAAFATSPTVLVVGATSPAKSLQDFVAQAKASPGKVNYGSGGSGTSVHLAGELFESLTGAQMVHIPYKGSADGAVSKMAWIWPPIRSVTAGALPL